MRTLYIALCLSILSYSCSTGPGFLRKKNGNITRRYLTSTTEDVGIQIKDYVRVGAFFYKEPEAPGTPTRKRLVADLPSGALTELIKQVGAKETTSDKIVAQLNAGIGNRPPIVEEFIDLTQFSKRLVVSVKDLLPGEANRISKVEVQVCFPQNFRLLSCNRFETLYETVDLGKLNFNRGTQAKIGANLSTGLTGGVTAVSGTKRTIGTGSDEFNIDNNENTGSTTTTSGDTNSQGVNAEISTSRSFAEEIALRQKRVVLTAMIEDNTLFLSQEGTSGIKLGGNVIADIIFDNKKNVAVERTYDFSELVDANKFTIPDKVKVTDVLIAFPNLGGDLTAEITFAAEYREVTAGDDTNSESDDNITLKYGATDSTTKKTVTLMSEDEYKPNFWIITQAGSPVPAVTMNNPAVGSGALTFNDYAMAKNFLMWLKGQEFAGAATSDLKLGTGGHALRLNGGGTFSKAAVTNLIISPLR